MRHEVFGKLKFDKEDRSWSTKRKFRAFTLFGQTPRRTGKGPAAFDVFIDGQGEGGEEGNQSAEPSAAQVRAFQFFAEHEQSVCGKVIGALYRWYVRRRKQDRQWFEDEECPEIRIADELRDLMQFSSLRVRRNEFKGTALLGFSFGCKWYDENGLGVLVHRGAVLEIGGADVAFSEPYAVGSVWLKVCTAAEKRAAIAVLKPLGALRREPPMPPYQELEIALIGRDRKKIQKLLDRGLDINAVPPGQYHPLFRAVYHSDVERVQLILELGADLKTHGPALVRYAINMIAMIGYREDLRPAVKERCEPLHRRATEVLRLLREAGAS